MSEHQAVKIEPVVKQIKVGLNQEAAFRLFTEGLNKWWPLATHSVGEDQAEACVQGFLKVKRAGSKHPPS